MRSITLLSVAACLGLVVADCDQQAVITSCSNDVTAQVCPTAANGVVDQCGCSKVSRILSCYSVNCPGEPQVSPAAAAEYSAFCLSGGSTGRGTISTYASSVSSLSTTTAAAAGTGINMLAPATATRTESGSAAPASTSKAWSQKSQVIPAGEIIAAALGLAILL